MEYEWVEEQWDSVCDVPIWSTDVAQHQDDCLHPRLRAGGSGQPVAGGQGGGARV